ncbi:MAG TPA: hypothetical protein VJV79_18070 [Polyangiaceae bacterium]|nr:hypothetical protein [Polyangiaceae bacterium]
MSEPNHLSSDAQSSDGGMVRAYWVAQGGEFFRHHFESNIRSKVEQAFSSDLGSALSGGSMSDWVLRSHLVELLEATANARGGLESFSDLASYGEFIERRATNRFTELLAKTLTPQLLLRKLPLFWRRDHGLVGVCVIDACEVGQARFHLEGVAGFPHIGAVWLGWVRSALGSVQARSVELKQSGYSAATPGAPRIEFEVSWL